MSISTPTLDYAAIDLMLRAPRVAVIVDGSDKGWVAAARIALAQCAEVWGGAGFVLVPHHDGKVDRTVLEAVVAYDPDYVATSARTIAERETASPGALVLADENGAPITGEERVELIARVGEQEVFDELAAAARDTVVAACSTHRMREEDEEGEPVWDDPLHQLGNADPTGLGLTHVDRLHAFADKVCVSAPPAWGGALGLLAAAKLGAVQRPDLTPSPPTVTGDAAVWMSAWLQGVFNLVPQEATELVANPSGGATFGFQVEQLPQAWHNSLAGLTSVSVGSTRQNPAWVVVGDSPDDFAVWMVLDRLYGHAAWLHPDWFSADSPESHDVLHSIAYDWQRAKRGLHVTSARADQADVNTVRDLLQGAIDSPRPGRNRPRKRTVSSGDIPWSYSGSLTLAARDNFSAEFPVPVHRDGEGGVEMVMKPPGLTLADSLARQGSHGFSWQVELSFDGSVMPRRRGLPGRELCAKGQDPAHTYIRNSRTGITWHSDRYDFTTPGMAPDQQVARPKVRELSLSDWAEAMSRQRGYTTPHSASGISAQVLATLWGGRAQMIDDLAGQWSEVLRLFGPAGAAGSKGSSATYQEGRGVVITGHGGVLTFKGIAGCWPDDVDPGEVRMQVDRLVSGRVLRRGLALLCAECRKAAFVAVDELSQTNRCASCSANNDLNMAAWKKPDDEPLWFYDLHPVARELVQMNGVAPLAVAHHIKASSKTFTDAAETELFSGSKPVAETDVLIHADGLVITGEVKTSDQLHNNGKERLKAVGKRALWADVLRADEIVLATTRDQWVQSSVTAMTDCLASYAWTTPGHRPRLRLLTGVGGAAVASEYVDW